MPRLQLTLVCPDGFDAHPSHYPQTAAHRASALTRAALLFRRQLKRGLMQPDATKEGPLCMDTWRWMFDCCRVPSPRSDWSVTYAAEGSMGNSGHIIVFRRGRPWRIDVAPHGQILSTEELHRQVLPFDVPSMQCNACSTCSLIHGMISLTRLD